MPRFWDLLKTCKVSAIGRLPANRLLLTGPQQSTLDSDRVQSAVRVNNGLLVILFVVRVESV